MIKVPFPEMNDTIQCLARVDGSLDVEIEMSVVTVAALLALAAQLETATERKYYTKRILAWHNLAVTTTTPKTDPADR